MLRRFGLRAGFGSIGAAAVSSVLALSPAVTRAQAIPSARLEVLEADDRRAAEPRDLATLRSGARSGDPVTARMALRALGRLERAALITDILPGLRHAQPDVRAQAANAIGQAARGWATAKPAAATGPSAVLAALVARLEIEAEDAVRAALCETIGRLPYTSGDDAGRAERALVQMAARDRPVADRLGAVKGLEAFVRVSRGVHPIGPEAIDALRGLLGVGTGGAGSPAADVRDARVRRLAIETLSTVQAIDGQLLARAAADIDPQVRRLAMRTAAVAGPDAASIVEAGLSDAAAMVRLEALRAVRVARGASSCGASLAAAADRDPHVTLLAIDQLAVCGGMADAVALLDRLATDLDGAARPRAWHRAAHALVALAAAAPERASALLPQYAASPIWQLRMYAARAAAELRTVDALIALTRDASDNVVETAIDHLARLGGHQHDAVYIAALDRPGYPVVRAAAVALTGASEKDAAAAALTRAMERLADAPDNADTPREAVAAALTSLGLAAQPKKGRPSPPADIQPAELRRLAAPIARVTIRGVGRIDFALFPAEAPLTVLRFAQLAETGYYNGLTFHRVVPNFVIQGGSPGANEYIGHPAHMRDEVGLWPHVRGAAGISTRGRDTGDAQFFINLVDNPRFDHEYTVFAQVLNGLDVLDQVLEGDVIERIEIVP